MTSSDKEDVTPCGTYGEGDQEAPFYFYDGSGSMEDKYSPYSPYRNSELVGEYALTVELDWNWEDNTEWDWSYFWSGYSEASYGVLNAILGGLFETESGIPYMVSESVREWADKEAFQSGEAGWRFAEGPLLAAGPLIANSNSGTQYRWFRTHLVSWDTTQGGYTVTLGGRLTYVGKHAALANEAEHSRQIIINTGENVWKTIIKW